MLLAAYVEDVIFYSVYDIALLFAEIEARADEQGVFAEKPGRQAPEARVAAQVFIVGGDEGKSSIVVDEVDERDVIGHLAERARQEAYALEQGVLGRAKCGTGGRADKACVAQLGAQEMLGYLAVAGVRLVRLLPEL